MIHPDTEIRFINDIVGYGVVATKLIPKGTITWVQDELDRVYTPEEVQKLSPLMRNYLETYCFMNAKGEKVLCWDYAKYVNHSFKPTCFSTAYDFEFALRDIEPGEQLTDDYGYLNLEEPFEALDECAERKVVYPDDILTYHKEWDLMIKNNLPAIFAQTSQPLLQFIPKHTWSEFKKLEHDPSQMVSLLHCHYHSHTQDKAERNNANAI
jgi:hypothetical protein